jgi:glycine/D-amino acid oxidase-like deaminating enzyme
MKRRTFVKGALGAVATTGAYFGVARVQETAYKKSVHNSIVPKTADVVIIGGGIVGCAAAYYLAKRGVKIALVEKGDLSTEGSGHTFGAIRTFGKGPAELPLTLKSAEMWKNLSAELNCDVGYRQGGGLILAKTEDELEPLEQYVERSREVGGLDFKMVTPGAIKRMIPPMEAPMAGALHAPSSGRAERVLPAMCFAGAARKLGAEFYTQTLCVGVEVSGGKVSGVVTDKGEIKAPTVISATGVHANRMAELVDFDLPLKIIRITEGETEPLKPDLFKPWFVGPLTAVQTGSGTIIFGSKESPQHDIGFDALDNLNIWLPRFANLGNRFELEFEGGHLKREMKRIFGPSFESRRKGEFPTFEPDFSIEGAERGFRKMQELMPSLKEVGMGKISAGRQGLSPDMLPVIGELDHPKGFITAGDCSGTGYALGPAIGELLSELIVDGQTSLSIDAFRPSRFADGSIDMPSPAGYAS